MAIILFGVEMPGALLATLGTFALMLLLSRLRVPLWAAILAGAVAMCAMFGLAPMRIAQVLAAAVSDPMTLSLVVVISMLLMLSQMMRMSGQMEQIVSLARAILRRPAVSMAALPALIGLIPMPGGAVFSAPMVETSAGSIELAAGRMSAINYWFRHIWEYWWPMYPAVIVAVALTGLDMGTFVAFQCPMTIVMVLSGLVLFRNTHPDLHVRGPAPQAGTIRKFVGATSSIWIILLVWTAATLLLTAMYGQAPRRMPGEPPLTDHQKLLKLVHEILPLALGLVASLAWTARRNRIGGVEVVRLIAKPDVWSLAVLVLAIMVFQFVLNHADIQVPARISAELERMHVPLILAVAILPFIAGLVTGLGIGFVGSSFPIVMGLVHDKGSIVPYVALAYACGHMGMMISPLHLCLVVSNRYFKVTFGPVYRHLLLPALLTAIGFVGYAAILWLFAGR